MIKKLIACAAFAGSMVIGVPAAHANGIAQCYMQYDAAMALCSYIDEDGGMSNCSQVASVNLSNCLSALAVINE